MIVTDERVARFVSERIGFGLCPPYTAMGVERDGKIVGGVVFNMFEGKDLHVTVAGGGFGKKFLEAVGIYVFEQLGYLRMTVQTEQKSVISLAERLGGKQEGVLRDHFGEGRDAVIMGILKSEYRFR